MKILLTFYSVVILAVLGMVGFIYSGIYDFSALHPNDPILAWAVKTTADQSVTRRIRNIKKPAGLDRSEVIQTGGQLFVVEQCWLCHRPPGTPPNAIAQGLDPSPADLFSISRQPHTKEMFWIIQNGLTMTAMPAFGQHLSDEAIWSISAFLKTAPGMSRPDFDSLNFVKSVPTEKPKGD